MRALPAFSAASAPCGRGARPHSGRTFGGSKPSPVSRTVSERKACSWARFSGPPSARYTWASAHTPIGTVDCSISSALGDCSPPSTTIGFPVARIRAKPEHRSCGEPRMRATTRSAASIAAAMSW